jgi:serine-aspartate repeat-containing protein C/D/E
MNRNRIRLALLISCAASGCASMSADPGDVDSDGNSDGDSDTDADSDADTDADADSDGDTDADTETDTGTDADTDTDVDIDADADTDTDTDSGSDTEDPCEGVVCDDPPDDYCTDADYLTVYEVPGTCDDGLCGYDTHQAYCSYGCVLGACAMPECTSGVCCDTAAGAFQPSSFACSSWTEYGCTSSDCGGDGQSRTVTQSCTGASADCAGAIAYGDWSATDSCADDELCSSSSADAWCAYASSCDSTCGMGANVAPSATASSSGGGVTTYNRGPEEMNDGNLQASCDFHWINSGTSPGGTAWIQLTWSTAQTLHSIWFDTGAGVCSISSGRELEGGTVEWWNGSSWVSDGVESGHVADWSHTFASPVTTTSIRLYGAYAYSTSNAVIFEWQAYQCE